MSEHLDGASAELTSFIAENWVPAGDGYTLDSPSSGRIVSHVSNASKKDVDRAVEAARSVFDRTRWMPMRERAAICEKVAQLIERDPAAGC